jgi:hypothetical protein
VEPILVTRAELEKIKRLQVKKRSDWPATFSVNWYGRIWPWANWGLTPDCNREPIEGTSAAVDEIAGRFLDLRPEGSRFFVDATGAYYAENARKQQFVNFRHRP